MTATHLLIYQPIKAPSDWRPLLQQQAVLAVSRAVAAYRDALLAPTHPDVVTLLATTARDRAQGDPPRSVHLYGEPEPPIRPLLGQSGPFNVTNEPLRVVVERLAPKSCIILGDKRFVQASMSIVPASAQNVIYLRALTGSDFEAPPPAIAADVDRDLRVDGGLAEGPMVTPWHFPGEPPALEPFVAFGLAFERALWNAGRPR